MHVKTAENVTGLNTSGTLADRGFYFVVHKK